VFSRKNTKINRNAAASAAPKTKGEDTFIKEANPIPAKMPDKYSERFLQQSSISSPKQPGALSTNAKFGNVRLNLDFSF